MSEDQLKDNLAGIERQIEIACRETGRNSSEIKILAVSKSQPVEKIIQLYALGMRDFGENYIQELASKKSRLSKECPEIRWHFIGHIQSNKALQISQCHMVHSVDSLSHAQALARSSTQLLAILVQVNLGDQSVRSGFAIHDVDSAVTDINSLPNLRVQGLMAILPVDSLHDQDYWFNLVREKRDQISQATGLKLPELSMGMSGDFQHALRCGATWIRLGSALFGAREKP